MRARFGNYPGYPNIFCRINEWKTTDRTRGTHETYPIHRAGVENRPTKGFNRAGGVVGFGTRNENENESTY
jgi:hypothetical protein